MYGHRNIKFLTNVYIYLLLCVCVYVYVWVCDSVYVCLSVHFTCNLYSVSFNNNPL